MKRYITKILILTICITFTGKALAFDMFMDDFSSQYDMFLQEQKEKSYESEENTRKNFLTDEVEPQVLEQHQDSAGTTKAALKSSKKTREKELDAPKRSTDIEVYSDDLQYIPDKNEFEATGNARMYIPQDKSTLWADRLVFNRDENVVKGFGNVRIQKFDSTAYGDYIQINLNDKNALMEQPVIDDFNIKIVAKNSNFYPGKLIVESGQITSSEGMTFNLGATTFGNFFDPLFESEKPTSIMKEKYNNEYRVKAKVVEVNCLKDNDELVLRGADIYLKNIKIGSASTLRFLTDKTQQYVETNTPEFSSLKQFGLFLGPGYVINLPKSATLKVAPVVLYSNSDWGIGGIGRLRTADNVTEAAYGTIRNDWVVRGKQRFNDKVWMEYSYKGYLSEWFLGDRVPGKLIQLVYHDDYVMPEHNLTFAHRLTAGYAGDKDSHWGTSRFRYQGQLAQTLYSRVNPETKTAFSAGYDTDGTVTLYGNGQTHGIFRVGPFVQQNFKNSTTRLGYKMGAVHGETPFMFDKYMYGKQNIYFLEMLKLSKYVSIAYTATLALLKDNWDNKMVQENRFFIVFGPDDIKINLGYDTVRQRSIFNFQLAVGTENTKLDFDKMVVKDPERLGKKSKTEMLTDEARHKIKKIFLPDEAAKEEIKTL